MKHIKTYKLFESESPEELTQYLRDIFQELVDNGFKVKIASRRVGPALPPLFKRSLYYNIKSNFNYYGSIEVSINKPAFLPFKLSEIKDCVDSSKSYMRSNGYKYRTAKQGDSYLHSNPPGSTDYVIEYIIIFTK